MTDGPWFWSGFTVEDGKARRVALVAGQGRRSSFLFCVLLFLLLLGGFASQVARASDGWVTLEEIKSVAVRQSPSLAAAHLRWEAAREAALAAGALPDPVFRTGIFLEEVQTKTGPQRQRLGLSQRLPMPGKLSLGRQAAESVALAAAEDYRAARYRVLAKVERSYLKQANLFHSMTISREQIKLLLRLEGLLREKWRTGTASRASLLRLQIEREKQQDLLAGLGDLRQATIARLRAFSGWDPSAELNIDTQLPEAPLPEGDLRQILLDGNPELAALSHRASALKHDASLAARSGWPDFNVGLDWILTEGGEDPLVLSLGLNLPLWRGKVAAHKSAAAARQDSGEQVLAARRYSLLADLEEILADWRGADRRLRLIRETLLPRSREILELREEGVRAGQASFADLLEARDSFLQLRLAELDSLEKRAVARADLLRLCGLDTESETP